MVKTAYYQRPIWRPVRREERLTVKTSLNLVLDLISTAADLSIPKSGKISAS
jgi:hypothetical protein